MREGGRGKRIGGMGGVRMKGSRTGKGCNAKELRMELYWKEVRRYLTSLGKKERREKRGWRRRRVGGREEEEG